MDSDVNAPECRRSVSTASSIPTSPTLQANIHPTVASKRAGHASVAITLDIYSHVLPGMQAEAAARVDADLRAALEE